MLTPSRLWFFLGGGFSFLSSCDKLSFSKWQGEKLGNTKAVFNKMIVEMKLYEMKKLK